MFTLNMVPVGCAAVSYCWTVMFQGRPGQGELNEERGQGEQQALLRTYLNAPMVNKHGASCHVQQPSLSNYRISKS